MWFPKTVCRLVFIAVLVLVNDGFSQTNTLPQISAIDATNYLNQQVVVVDKVVQVAFRTNIWLLHLNQKYPKSPLNAVIRKSFTNNFPNISDCLGQKVELTGRITDHQGRLELVLTDTNQIKILSRTQTSAKVASPAIQAQTETTLSAPPTTPLALPTTSAPANSPAPAMQAVAKDESNPAGVLEWILGLLAAIVGLLGMGVFMAWRRQADVAQIIPPPRVLLIPNVATADSPSIEDWKQRALAAEAMAGKQGQLLREKLIPELAEFAKQSLVQGLFEQRNVLMETQRKAQLALMELESRLKMIQAPLQERIRAYEKRVAELEREVDTQGEELRELTRATLALVRQKLEEERENERLQSRFN